MKGETFDFLAGQTSQIDLIIKGGHYPDVQVMFPIGCRVRGPVCGVCIRQLFSDVYPDETVDSTDLSDVQNGVSPAVDSSNFRADVQADGSVDLIDRIDVRDAVDTQFVGTCP